MTAGSAHGPGTGTPRGSGPAESAAGHPAPTVLIVDRDEPTRAAVVAQLRAHGFEVVGESADPGRTRERALELRPDVIVLAIQPGLADVPALAQVAAERLAPVVVLSDDAGREQVAAVREAGAHAFLPAFPSRATLVPAVELAIARFAELARLTSEIEAAARRLETRKLIDRAKGLLMANRGMTEPEAFRWIQRAAMDRRKNAATIARQVIADFEPVKVAAAS